MSRCAAAAAATAPVPSRWHAVAPGPKSWKIENRAGRDIQQEAGLTKPIGQPVAFRNKPGQMNVRPPLVDQCPKNGLDLCTRGAPDDGDGFLRDHP
jgi:hypothetical protein